MTDKLRHPAQDLLDKIKSGAVRSDNIRPVNVNILPMQIVVDEVVVNHCVEVLGHELPFDSTALRQIVLSVLRAATDSALGHQENGKS